jgi:hypothetical protein
MDIKTDTTVNAEDNLESGEVWLEGFFQPFRATTDKTNPRYDEKLDGKYNVPGVEWSAEVDNNKTKYLKGLSFFTDILQIGADYRDWTVSISSAVVKNSATNYLIEEVAKKFTDEKPVNFDYHEHIKAQILVTNITNDNYRNLVVKDIKFI